MLDCSFQPPLQSKDGWPLLGIYQDAGPLKCAAWWNFGFASAPSPHSLMQSPRVLNFQLGNRPSEKNKDYLGSEEKNSRGIEDS